MANPRKFSEKIALHNQKQAEETAAFEQIMKEVYVTKRGPVVSPSSSYQNQHLSINPSLGTYRGGSLPNVNQIGNMANNSIDLQASFMYNNSFQVTEGQVDEYHSLQDWKSYSTVYSHLQKGALNNLEDIKKGQINASERIPRERVRNITAPHRNKTLPERRHDLSPYGSSTCHLPLPSSDNWRRTNSDSALHQSAMAPQDNFPSAKASPSSQRRGTGNRVHEMIGFAVDNIPETGYYSAEKTDGNCFLNAQDVTVCGMSSHNRPKSCEVPGINIYPSQEDPNVIHVPISNNTGSLPDLTNLHFPPPLTTPIDVEDPCTSPYNQQTPPHSSPSSLSPTALPPQQLHTHVIGSNVSGGTMIHTAEGLGPPVSGSSSRHTSPGPSPSPSSQRRIHHNTTNLVMGTSPSRHHSPQSSPQVRLKHNTPRITVEGLTVDTNALTLESYPVQHQQFGVYPQQQQTQHYHQQQQHHNPPSPHQQHQGNHNTQVYGPPPTSPTLPQMPISQYRSSSPGEHSWSAPTSPVSQTVSPVSSPGLSSATSLSKSPTSADTNYYGGHQQHQQTSALQHQLEQSRMLSDGQDHHSQYFVMPDSNNFCGNASVPTSTSYISDPGGGGGGCGLPGTGDVRVFSYCDPSHNTHDSLYYEILGTSVAESHVQSPPYTKSSVISSSQVVPQTPQTPTSIPDIVLTGPCADEPTLKQDIAKDIGSAMASMSDSFDSDLVFTEDALRESLGPIDLDGYQILTDPDMSVISDPATEETFRLDRS